jgi:hypothetical protein
MNEDTQVAGIIMPDADDDQVAGIIMDQGDGDEPELARTGTIIPCL